MFQLILHHSNIKGTFNFLELWLKVYLKLKILQSKGNLTIKKIKSKKHTKKLQLYKVNHLFELLNKGKLYGCITSRSGQVGKAEIRKEK